MDANHTPSAAHTGQRKMNGRRYARWSCHGAVCADHAHEQPHAEVRILAGAIGASGPPLQFLFGQVMLCAVASGLPTSDK